MKKFMFSAVALVAFSFAGMANNEGKEVEVKDICFEYADDVLTIVEAYSPCEISFEQATQILNHAIAECEGYHSSDMIN